LCKTHGVRGGGIHGTILEAGAGKGEFLLQFLDMRPQWASTAFEPSTAVENLKERLQQTTVYHGGYQQMSLGRKFDVVASLAVIEHVEDSYGFMEWLRGQMTDSGHLLLTFPDFALNPNDMFCVDHLSKIALPQLLMMAAKAGLELVAHGHVGIAMLALLRKAKPTGSQVSVKTQALKIAQHNEKLSNQMVAGVTSAHAAASASGERFAIFGLGMAGLVAPVFSRFERSEITAYIDENPTMHGLKFGNVSVVDLPQITALGIKHVALSVSPIYREQVMAKLRPYGVKVYG
jgi:2-polyprenyl-3-methyl-5-hydroxy-6-metoxy-1,4-benzoquinol methylase